MHKENSLSLLLPPFIWRCQVNDKNRQIKINALPCLDLYLSQFSGHTEKDSICNSGRLTQTADWCLHPNRGLWPLLSAFCLLCLPLLLPHTCLFPMKRFSTTHPRLIFHISQGLERAHHLGNAKLLTSSVPGTAKLCFSQIALSTPPSCFHPPYRAPSHIPDSALATGTAHCSSSLPQCSFPGEPSVVSQQVSPQFHQKPDF